MRITTALNEAYAGSSMGKSASLAALPPHGLLVGEQISPDRRVEQEQKREKFQASGKHVKDKDILGEIREKSEIARRTYKFQAGTDVVDRSGNGRKGGSQVCIFEGNQEYGHHKQNNEGDHINIDRTDDVMVDRFVIHFDFLDALRVNIGDELLAHRFKQDNEP